MLNSMRVEIDPDRCLGHGRCVVVCPELFTITDSGSGSVILAEVPPELVGRARQAVLNCPERAITLTGPIPPPDPGQQGESP